MLATATCFAPNKGIDTAPIGPQLVARIEVASLRGKALKRCAAFAGAKTFVQFSRCSRSQ